MKSVAADIDQPSRGREAPFIRAQSNRLINDSTEDQQSHDPDSNSEIDHSEDQSETASSPGRIGRVRGR